MKCTLIAVLLLLALVNSQAQTHSIMKQIQKDIAKMQLPRSFFAKTFQRRAATHHVSKVDSKKKKVKGYRFKQVHHKKENRKENKKATKVDHDRLKKKHRKVMKINPNESLGGISIHL